MKNRGPLAVFAGLSVILLSACGGGSMAGSASPGSPTISSIVPVCSPLSIAPGATSQCAATVQGTGNFSSADTWSVSAGSISTSGLFTAPSAAGKVVVTATSQQDPTKTGRVTITVQPAAPAITSVTVTCAPSSIAAGATSQCSANVQGTGSFSSAVTWSASGGTMSTNGLLTAPGASGTITVTATSTQDAAKTGHAEVVVQAAASTITTVTVLCNPAAIAPNGTTQCNAAVQGTGSYSPAVTWSASAGSISTNGLLTGPATAGNITVTATSTQDTTKTGTAGITVKLQTPRSKHVVIVMEENQSYDTVVGKSAWPALNQLINQGALATNYYADSHPSIGNYFMLTTGQLLTTNDSSTVVWNVDNIARRMLASGVTFRVYAEGITQGYLGNNTGLYLVRHNPFPKLSDVADSTQVANATIWPFSQFATDLANDALPEFSFVVPDVDDDAHNGTPKQADTWLQTNLVTPLSNSPAFQAGGDGVLIVDFDEAADTDTTHGGGHIPAVMWGPNVQVGFKQASSTVYQHQSMLRTMMEALGLSDPPGAAATAPSMSEFFVQK